ncbi:ATP-dependent dethiobiotin synthetase BioD [Formosa sp. Hel1_33_131]|mgnify:CR=1 FL=1|jgi:dethiobiotin synthetase|uniref:dethiobiotin synthase n=1 Tax=Formosa sp. Hel1_33_131 TaxID=1336794 RepID=UPI00084E123D|nr:dethiobiotin synthase [Formosa sp. Hel1_33_131]AOR29321.1 ATP-dependent dethiobiotin synthetase BioD [Formosa sp. Hel1_33_131]
MKSLFITGIGTDVGKTVVSAIVTEALNADYWKPIQAGQLSHSDSHKIKALISNPHSKIFENSYALKTPMSPHAAAEIDDIRIDSKKIAKPTTTNNLVIEGAGGLLVPINDSETILDLIKSDYKVIVVSKHYLGSINHTLLTIELLKNRGIAIAGIIFNGNELKTSESIIKKMTSIPIIGRINDEKIINKAVVKRYATLLKPLLETL